MMIELGLATSFSALQRAEIAEICRRAVAGRGADRVSVLFNEPKLLKCGRRSAGGGDNATVSVLFNEPKLLKYRQVRRSQAV